MAALRTPPDAKQIGEWVAGLQKKEADAVKAAPQPDPGRAPLQELEQCLGGDENAAEEDDPSSIVSNVPVNLAMQQSPACKAKGKCKESKAKAKEKKNSGKGSTKRGNLAGPTSAEKRRACIVSLPVPLTVKKEEADSNTEDTPSILFSTCCK